MKFISRLFSFREFLMDIIYLQMLAIQEFFKTSTPNLYFWIAALGAIFVFYQLFIILRGFLRLLFRRRQNFAKVYGEKSWVLVTGSSQGIGKEFAMQFAESGFNIILLARTQSKLKAVRQQILGLYPSVQVEIVVADLLAQGKKQKIEDILPELNRFKNISIVVNNAGMDILGTFTSLTAQKVADLTTVNCFALAAICHKFIPYFENRMKETGKKCGFINVGSVAGQIPVSLFNIYSASKAYVGQLTNNLSIQNPHINWLLLKPSEVSTAMTCFKNDIFTVSVKQCVSGALRDFGYDTMTNGALSHKIQSYLYSLLPIGVFNAVWSKVFAPGMMKEREEYHKKQE